MGQSFDVYAQGYEDGVTNVEVTQARVLSVGLDTATDAAVVADFYEVKLDLSCCVIPRQSTNGNNNEFTLDLGSKPYNSSCITIKASGLLNSGPYSKEDK